MQQKAVLITGASGGIGQALALRFHQAGYALFLQAHTHRKTLEAFMTEHEITAKAVYEADLSDFDQCTELCRSALDQCRREGLNLSVLINNAGIACFSLLQDLSQADWDRVMNTNVRSVFACSRAILPSMISRKQGRIINISSMWGSVGASMETVYSASKGAVNTLTRALAKEVAPSGICVNAIACGVIDTPMNDVLNAEEKEALAEEIPAGRFGTPQETAEVALFLADAAPDYLTGQVIGLDGGYI